MNIVKIYIVEMYEAIDYGEYMGIIGVFASRRLADNMCATIQEEQGVGYEGVVSVYEVNIDENDINSDLVQ